MAISAPFQAQSCSQNISAGSPGQLHDHLVGEDTSVSHSPTPQELEDYFDLVENIYNSELGCHDYRVKSSKNDEYILVKRSGKVIGGVTISPKEQLIADLGELTPSWELPNASCIENLGSLASISGLVLLPNARLQSLRVAALEYFLSSLRSRGYDFIGGIMQTKPRRADLLYGLYGFKSVSGHVFLRGTGEYPGDERPNSRVMILSLRDDRPTPPHLVKE